MNFAPQSHKKSTTLPEQLVLTTMSGSVFLAFIVIALSRLS